MTRPALKLMETRPFFEEEGELWSVNRKENHSLHYTCFYRDSFEPELPGYFIRKFTTPGSVVLDPFGGRGTTALEANLLNRVAYTSDANPLASKICRAKLSPVDISEVTLFLQRINFNQPVPLERYNEYFSPFYDFDTYREISNLRRYIQNNPGRAASFVELLALSLLHGHTAGYFSVYSFPQISVSSAAQREINDRRGHTVEYRAVAPRIIRKAAMTLRDGAFSLLEGMAKKNLIHTADARDLSFVRASSVDLVVTSPPRPASKSFVNDFWLEFWFSCIQKSAVETAMEPLPDITSWLDFMNGTLLELARVVKSGGRAVFDLREVRLGEKTVRLDIELLEMINESLSKFWQGECVLVHKPQAIKMENLLRERESSKQTRNNRLLILRRK